jgi:hypothetical protein
LAEQGCDLMLTARDAKALEDVAQAIRAKQRKSALRALDLREPGSEGVTNRGAYRRLEEIPGVGPIVATALVSRATSARHPGDGCGPSSAHDRIPCSPSHSHRCLSRFRALNTLLGYTPARPYPAWCRGYGFRPRSAKTRHGRL